MTEKYSERLSLSELRITAYSTPETGERLYRIFRLPGKNRREDRFRAGSLYYEFYADLFSFLITETPMKRNQSCPLRCDPMYRTEFLYGLRYRDPYLHTAISAHPAFIIFFKVSLVGR